MTDTNDTKKITDVYNDKCSINWSLVTARIGDERLLDEILPIFMKDSTERMRMLADAVVAGDLKEVKFYAHSLKGASAVVGAAKFSDIARQLETAGREEKADEIGPLFAELKKAFGELAEFVAMSDWKQISKQHARANGSVQ